VAALAHDARIGRANAAQLLAAIEKRHWPISDAFCSDAGVRLMRIDGELTLSALRASNDDGIPALPGSRRIDRTGESHGLAAEKWSSRSRPWWVALTPVRLR
jgi:hypothetical protein